MVGGPSGPSLHAKSHRPFKPFKPFNIPPPPNAPSRLAHCGRLDNLENLTLLAANSPNRSISVQYSAESVQYSSRKAFGAPIRPPGRTRINTAARLGNGLLRRRCGEGPGRQCSSALHPAHLLRVIPSERVADLYPLHRTIPRAVRHR